VRGAGAGDFSADPDRTAISRSNGDRAGRGSRPGGMAAYGKTRRQPELRDPIPAPIRAPAPAPKPAATTIA